MSPQPVGYRVLRAALLPFLVIALAAGVGAVALAVQAWVELEARPPVGHGAGFAGLAVILGGLTGLAVAGGSAAALWAMWRPRRDRT